MTSGLPRTAPPPAPTHLTPVGRYDGQGLLGFLGAHAVPGVETWDGTTYARSLSTAHGPVVAEVRWIAPRLQVTLHPAYGVPQLPEPARADVMARLTHLLDADRDLAAGHRALRADPLLAPLVVTRPGLRVPGSADHGETLLRTIVGQQISVAGARTVTGRLVAAHGEPLTRPVLGVTHLFPAADSLAAADPATLPMPRARGLSVVAVALALADGLDATDVDQVLALRGVGPWTASYQALRAGRDLDVFLPTDLAARRALGRRGAPEDPAGADTFAARWSPWRSLALMHLWADYLAARPAARVEASAADAG